ncbi:MAG: DUF2848 domain-containing protein [Sphingobium sp.]
MAPTANVLDLVLDQPTKVPVAHAIIAGWTGRDKEAQLQHIRELEELGIKGPASTPVFYRVAARRLTTASAIEVSGEASSGEVEFVLLCHGGKLWVGVGSDHTDREAETHGITLSKQMCDKPVAAAFWDMQDVASHWDRLILRSVIYDGAERVIYQEGPVTTMLSPDDLLELWNAPFEGGSIMFCGTLAARGGIRPARRFEFELEDPVLGRRISHGYDCISLPVAG